MRFIIFFCGLILQALRDAIFDDYFSPPPCPQSTKPFTIVKNIIGVNLSMDPLVLRDAWMFHLHLFYIVADTGVPFSFLYIPTMRGVLKRRAENNRASNVNDAPLLAVDAPNENLGRHHDAPIFSSVMIFNINTIRYQNIKMFPRNSNRVPMFPSCHIFHS